MAKRNITEVDASSMADIAFLLLVFFLVTTTMNPDKGITVQLPPLTEEAESQPIPKRNVFSVLVNANNDLLVRGEPLSISTLRGEAKTFIANPNHLPHLSSSPNKAVISLKNDRATKYDTYLMVYNELKAAYAELWNEEAQRRYGLDYGEHLTKVQKKIVRNKYPLVLSEAEPTSY